MSTSPPPRGPLIENQRTMKLRVESLPTNIRRLRRDVRLDHIGLLFPERRVSLAKKYNLYHYISLTMEQKCQRQITRYQLFFNLSFIFAGETIDKVTRSGH